jgi:uracil-DNA glycosylase
MPLIHPKGSPSSRIWFIADAPFSSDIPKGYIFSGGMGWVFDKMCADACLKDYYITCRRPNTDDAHAFKIIENELNQYKPPFIVPFGSTGAFFCDCLKQAKAQKSYIGQLSKYVGSFLTADNNLLSYPHYIMPMYGIEKLVANWSERNITTYFDMQKLREEYYYWRQHGSLQPLPQRTLIYKELSLDELLKYFESFKQAKLLSVDIETCYPKGDSVFKPHPGYPITVGIAPSSQLGLSFNLFRDSPAETRILWRELDVLLSNARILGQNFFNFDAHFLRALGFNINLASITDTLIRHHILWPELPHKLQFMTRQYTRETFYKDEGHHWNLKNMLKLRRYNCLDVCVTYEVYEQQEDEFRERKEVA